MRRLFCAAAIGFAGFALMPAAKADVIYTVTTTGTISRGVSFGTFGPNGTELAGMTFTATQTFDLTSSTFNSYTAGDNYLNPATSSASITIGGNTYNIASNSSYYNQYSISAIANGASYDTIYASTENASQTAAFSDYLSTGALTHLSSDSLSQMLFYAVATDVNNSVGFDAPDGTGFAGFVNTISLNGGAPTAVPEPRSVALFSASLAGLGWLRRRNATLLRRRGTV